MIIACCSLRRVSYYALRVNHYRLYTTAAPSAHHSKPVVLRPYQEQCLQSCIEALDSGLTRIGVSLPTGSGKTTVFISLLSRIQPPVHAPQATRSLILTSSVEIAEQSVAQVKRLFPEWTVELEQGTNRGTGGADVTVATYQTLRNRLDRFDPSTLKAIIVDEAHRAAASSYVDILSRFHKDVESTRKGGTSELSQHSHTVPIIGFSATFSRHDGRALGHIFQRVVFHKDFEELMEGQWLCGVRVTSVKAELDLSDVTINRGEFSASSLEQVVNTNSVNELVVSTWMERAHGEGRKSTLIFCVTVAHVQQLTQKFRERGIDARYVYAETPAKERKAVVEAFKAGVFPVLINCAVLTEGADIPNVDCVMIAKPTRSRNLFTQMIGRGMRLSPGTGKTDCRIIDFVDGEARVGGVISVPTLFGLDLKDITVNDETPESLARKAKEMQEAKANEEDSEEHEIDEGPVLGDIVFEDLDGLWEKRSHDVLHTLSSYAWVNCGSGIYVLELLGNGYYRIEPASVGYENPDQHSRAVYFVPPNFRAGNDSGPSGTGSGASKAQSPFFRRRLLRTSDDLKDLLNVAESHSRLVLGIDTRSCLRNAIWRRAPASDAQKKLLRQNLPSLKGLTSDRIDEKLSSVTKGQAADCITLMKHGFKGRYEKRQREERQKARKASKKPENDGLLSGVARWV